MHVKPDQEFLDVLLDQFQMSLGPRSYSTALRVCETGMNAKEPGRDVFVTAGLYGAVSSEIDSLVNPGYSDVLGGMLCIQWVDMAAKLRSFGDFFAIARRLFWRRNFRGEYYAQWIRLWGSVHTMVHLYYADAPLKVALLDFLKSMHDVV